MDEARQARDFADGANRLVVLKVPKIIEGVLDPQSGVIDDLAKVYAIVPYSPERVIARGKELLPVWASANNWQAAQMPARSPIVRGTLTQGNFAIQHAAFFPLLQVVKNKEQDLDEFRDALRAAARTLETFCIRFLSAASGLADPGSAAEGALDTIPTATTSSLPDTLGIRTFTQGGTNGLQLLIAYEPYSLESGDTAVLQYQRLDTDPDWQDVAYDASGNALGPFLVGQTVKIRTRTVNQHGTRTSATRTLVVQAPV